MTIKTWNIEEETGYKPITTFYEDFSIADNFGIDAIKDTYKRAFSFCKDDYDEYKSLTELAMVLNWKMWDHYNHNNAYSDLYNDLWIKTDNYAMENLKGEDLRYYCRTTD